MIIVFCYDRYKEMFHVKPKDYKVAKAFIHIVLVLCTKTSRYCTKLTFT